MENPAGAPELPAVTVMVIETGVWVPQLSVGASNAGLGVGCGLAPAVATRGPANASVLMAINAASVVIVFIILLFICFFVVVWLCDCWMAAVAIQEKFLLDVGALFLTCFSENCGAKFLGEVKLPVQ